MSFPTGTQTPQSAPTGQHPHSMPPRKKRLRLTLWLLVFLAGAFAIVQAPLEIGRWRLAAAVRLRQKNEKEAAYAALDKAIASFPKSPTLLLQRAEWRLQDRQRDEALADCDRAIELAGDNEIAYHMRGELLFKAREFERAVEDFKRVETYSRRSGRPPLYDALNQSAYAQALAKSNIEEALKKANEALDIMPAEAQTTGTEEYYHRGLILDTRGYLYYLNNDHEKALEDMNDAIKRTEERLGKSAAGRGNLGASLESAGPKALAEGAAVMYYHRSLVLSALDRDDEAEKDLAKARQLIGREPDETLF
jgi:tetratricopeptide (TPR) repeat protein